MCRAAAFEWFGDDGADADAMSEVLFDPGTLAACSECRTEMVPELW